MENFPKELIMEIIFCLKKDVKSMLYFISINKTFRKLITDNNLWYQYSNPIQKIKSEKEYKESKTTFHDSCVIAKIGFINIYKSGDYKLFPIREFGCSSNVKKNGARICKCGKCNTKLINEYKSILPEKIYGAWACEYYSFIKMENSSLLIKHHRLSKEPRIVSKSSKIIFIPQHHQIIPDYVILNTIICLLIKDTKLYGGVFNLDDKFCGFKKICNANGVQMTTTHTIIYTKTDYGYKKYKLSNVKLIAKILD